jgi:hypothetical protein
MCSAERIHIDGCPTPGCLPELSAKSYYLSPREARGRQYPQRDVWINVAIRAGSGHLDFRTSDVRTSGQRRSRAPVPGLPAVGQIWHNQAALAEEVAASRWGRRRKDCWPSPREQRSTCRTSMFDVSTLDTAGPRSGQTGPSPSICRRAARRGWSRRSALGLQPWPLERLGGRGRRGMIDRATMTIRESSWGESDARSSSRNRDDSCLGEWRERARWTSFGHRWRRRSVGHPCLPEQSRSSEEF